MRFAYAAGGSGDSVNRGLCSGRSSGLRNTNGTVPSLLSIRVQSLTESRLPVVTMRFATNTSRSVCSLSGSGRSNSEDDSRNLHLNVSLNKFALVTVVVNPVQ